MNQKIRLQKIMSESGIASRRKSEELIKNGHVKVNGHVVKEMGIQVVSSDKIEVDNRPIKKIVKRTFLFYKPQKVITSTKDEKCRLTVSDFFDPKLHLFPVGRLDYDTSGLIIMTNDGELANLLMHPKYLVEKTYLAKIKGLINSNDLSKIRTGLKIKRVRYAPARIKVKEVDRERGNSFVEITLTEGKKHEVKEIFSFLGYPVRRLTRVQISFLKDEGMRSGMYRELREDEIKKLKSLSR
ncbi:pseudouridine synthase [Xylocopilactobacillus apis]|uniref:Pseudouridine synthase n=1 Tax=Xylocopilactobacillus apis TaxID=2932183 RepID=A0AAU9CYQ9_9LACO|nr:pseudouridine synthase [Xylocopilactobacillus apis]BDR56544.1 pseudouridine synthase [Xylocopilactobacillus apis]